MIKNILKSLTIFAVIVTSGCALLPEEIDVTKDWSPSKFYSEAHEAMTDGDYESAIKYFEKLEARYPYNKFAKQSQIEVIYAYYKWDEPESAIAAADRFIKVHPRHEKVDYAYYMRGLVRYNEGKDILSKLWPQEPSERDPKSMRAAFKYFSILLEKFPKSQYSEDAKKRMLFTRNVLAKHEVNVAKYYMKRKAYVAAVNRAKTVVENFQRTPSVKPALEILVAGYKKLEMHDLAQDTQRVLDNNYK